MKKKLFLAMLISACFAGAFLASCDKDDDGGSGTCTCKIYDRNGNLIDTAIEDLDDYGLDSCSELTHLGASQNPGYTFSCK